MYAVSTGFKAAADDPQRISEKEFVFDQMITPKPALTDTPDSGHQLMTGIIALYPFVDATGTNLKDFSGNTNDGTLSGLAASPWLAERGGALSFNGAGFVDLGNISSTLFSGDFTISAEVYIDDTIVQTEFILGKEVNSGDGLALFSRSTLSTYEVRFDGSGAGNFLRAGDNQATVSTWKRVLITRNGSTVSFYIDGILTTKGQFAHDGSSVAAARIGATSWTTALAWNGRISDLRVYSRGFNQDDASLDFNNPWAMFGEPVPFTTPTDYTDNTKSMGRFSQKQYEGDSPNSASLTVELNNDAKNFNFLMTNKTNIGNPGRVRAGFDVSGVEYIDRFIGYLDEVRFESTDRPKCRMVFGGRIQRTLERKIGSSGSEIDYYTAPRNPADLAWDILTVHGGLDSTATTTNPDIDYTSFLAYQSICTDLTFSLRAKFTGQSVAEGMRLIGQLTDAIIFGETDGKIYFRKFTPEESATPYLFTDASAHLDRAEIFFNKDRLWNQAIVWWGYNQSTDDWLSGGSDTKNNATSQSNFGIFQKTFDGKTVWHDNAISAGTFGERYVARYSEPMETVKFKTKRGTQALIHQMGDNINLTWAQMGYSTKLMRIYGIVGDLTRDVYEILAEDMKNLNANYFILDSQTNGKLDQNVLF